MGRKKKRLLLAKILGQNQVVPAVNEQITDSSTVVPQIVEEDKPVVADKPVAEEVAPVVTPAHETVKTQPKVSVVKKVK